MPSNRDAPVAVAWKAEAGVLGWVPGRVLSAPAIALEPRQSLIPSIAWRTHLAVEQTTAA